MQIEIACLLWSMRSAVVLVLHVFLTLVDHLGRVAVIVRAVATGTELERDDRHAGEHLADEVEVDGHLLEVVVDVLHPLVDGRGLFELDQVWRRKISFSFMVWWVRWLNSIRAVQTKPRKP